MKNINKISNNIKYNNNDKILVFILREAFFYNNINIKIINDNIKKAQSGLKFIFIDFFMIVFNLKN